MPFLFCWYGISISYPILFYWNMSRFASSFDNLQPDISSPIWDNRMTYRVCAISAYKLLIDLCFWMVNVRAENWLINKLLTSRILFPPSFPRPRSGPFYSSILPWPMAPPPQFSSGGTTWPSIAARHKPLPRLCQAGLRSYPVPEAIAMEDAQIPADTNSTYWFQFDMANRQK